MRPFTEEERKQFDLDRADWGIGYAVRTVQRERKRRLAEMLRERADVLEARGLDGELERLAADVLEAL